MGLLDLGMLAGQCRPSLALVGLPCNLAQAAHQLPAPGKTLCALDGNGEVSQAAPSLLGLLPQPTVDWQLLRECSLHAGCAWYVDWGWTRDCLHPSLYLLYVPWLPAQGGDGPCHAVPWNITGYPPCVCIQTPVWSRGSSSNWVRVAEGARIWGSRQLTTCPGN